MDKLAVERAVELDKVSRYLEERKIFGSRLKNSLMEKYLSIPLPEVEGVFVHVEWLAAGDFRYRLTMVNCRDSTSVPELIGAVMSPPYVFRTILSVREVWWDAHPDEYQEWVFGTFPPGIDGAFQAGAAEGRT